MNKMALEKDIDKRYDNMTIEERGRLIDLINSILMRARLPVHLYEDINNENFRKFLSKYVRTDDEVFDENISYFEISCPIEFLDKQAMISMDNDYDYLMDNLHLNTYRIYDCDYDDLIKDNILVEYKKGDKK